MIIITYIILFILGMAFAQWGIPFIDQLLSIFFTATENLKARISVDITKSQVEIETLANQGSGSQHAIGFVTEEESIEDEYDDEAE